MVLQVFEHQRIIVGTTEGFTQRHFDALLRFKAHNGGRYFKIIPKGVQFRSFVGVLQVGDLTIEILPKADLNGNPNRNEWQRVLVEMLRIAKLIQIDTTTYARLRLRKHFLLDIYFELLLEEIEKRLHEGLLKQYRTEEGNRSSLKGKLHFQHQITKNLAQANRFYTSFQTYDYHHILHQILSQTLHVLNRIVTDTRLKSRIKKAQLGLPETSSKKVQNIDFQGIKWNRKTERYKKAIDICQLILLNYNPDIRSGQFDVLAMLFDMNVLFEVFVFQQLKRFAPEFNAKVYGQPRKKFWNHRQVVPDIVIEKEGKNYVLDTKWKVLSKSSPSDEDLRQIYVYQHYFDAVKSFLLYPKVLDYQEDIKGYFKATPQVPSLQADLLFLEITTSHQGRIKLNSEGIRKVFTYF